MVIGDGEAMAPVQQSSGGVPPPASIDNIMSGISNTGSVKMNNHRKKLRQRFDIIKKLGQGTYGKVQLGINKETGQEVAIKTIKKCKIETDADLIRIRREVQIMSSVQHPNIIHIYEVFENREKMVLVMEFAAGGELYDYLSERKVLSEDEARRVFRQISTAVYYCHKHKICHRDLKLENILLDENGNAKIADFGLSNVFDDQRLLATFCGSPLYASPEIVKGTPYQGPEVDCWSLGVLLYTLVYGAMPFDGSNFKRLVKQISAGDYYEPKKSSPASPLIKEMLTVCPQRRATIEQICNHWWVNTGYPGSCLDLAEELANQTPVRLDVLLSLTPSAVTSDQLVVPGSAEETKPNERVPRSHSVGSIRDIGNTEAERRIIDMVAAGGEAALAPSPTRTITPSESPAQPKRKLETTQSTENAIGIAKKKEKPTDQLKCDPSRAALNELMEEDVAEMISSSTNDEQMLNVDHAQNLNVIEDMCNKLLNEEPHPPALLPQLSHVETPIALIEADPVLQAPAMVIAETAKDASGTSPEKRKVIKKKIVKTDSNKESTGDEKVAKKSPVKTVKKVVSKTKTTDPGEAAAAATTASVIAGAEKEGAVAIVERKNSLPDENRSTERRRSRIFEAAEKFQSLNSPTSDKPKKIVIPGVSVGNFKKEFERKASLTGSPVITPTERRSLEKRGSDSSGGQPSDSRKSSLGDTENVITPTEDKIINTEVASEPHDHVSGSVSLTSFSLEEARRSMENSIALLNQAKTESSKEVDQLCAKTENFAVSDDTTSERLKKIKNAREIIGNAIPLGRMCMGVRKPPVPFGLNGRSVSGSVVPSPTAANMNDRKSMRLQVGPEPTDMKTATLSVSTPEHKTFDRGEPFAMSKPIAVGTLIDPENPTTKTSRAEITLKSATLPRRKTTKAEFQLDLQPKVEPSMRFQTEMQHHIPDLRSAPIRETPSPYSPLSVQSRAASLEPLAKEHIISVQRPNYAKNNTTILRPGTLSRQSTIESDTDTTATQSQSQVSSSATQPIKKSPREFIIPIAVEGGGFVTPRSGSLEPSESNHTNTSSSTFSRLGRPRRIGSLLNDRDSEDESPFQKLHRHTSIGRESDTDEPRFAMHRLRTTRPIKKISQDKNDSGSSGEDDDDEDGFELLTAENLFSTLLSRVRALTNRMSVNETTTASPFPSSRFMGLGRQTHSPFWNHDPFGSKQYNYYYRSESVVHTKETRLNNNGTGAWRHSLSRDLSSDIDSMFSRSGATLPRGTIYDTQNSPRQQQQQQQQPQSGGAIATPPGQFNGNGGDVGVADSLDLGDLDLSRLRLTKQDLETLSNLTPALPKHFQDQLLAQLPPNQARKLSRTLSMQSSSQTAPVKVYKRSLSGGRDVNDTTSAAASASSTVVDPFDRNSVFRRSSSRTRDTDTRCDDLSTPPPSYRYACGDTSNVQQHTTPYKSYDTLPPRLGGATKDGRPPSGCLSPPPPSTTPSNPASATVPPTSDSPVRRRQSQRRISRFLRPDFFDTPQEDSVYIQRADRTEREIDTQNVLREIRERSRDRAAEFKRERSAEPFSDRSYYSNLDAITSGDKERRKSSVSNGRSMSVDPVAGVRKSSDTIDQRPKANCLLTQPNGPNEYSNGSKQCFTDKILDELANLSHIKTSTITANLTLADSSNATNDTKRVDKTDVVKPVKLKINRINSKETIAKPSTTIIETDKEIANNISMVTSLTNEIDSVTTLPKLVNNEKPIKKLSKLIRPKSYPSKEQSPSEMTKKVSPERIEETNEAIDASMPTEKPTTTTTNACTNKNEETKLARPKSYPASKITKPKELKKCGNGAVACGGVQSDKSESSASDSIGVNNSSVAEKLPANGQKPSEMGAERPVNTATTTTAVKKVKVVKKIVKSDGKAAATLPKEVSAKSVVVKAVAATEGGLAVAVQPANKEKSPEKKPRSGFLYSIGQKFEKLRENSKNKVKKSNSKATVAETIVDPIIRRDKSSKAIESGAMPEIIQKKTKISAAGVVDPPASTQMASAGLSNITAASSSVAVIVDKDVSTLKEEIKSSERKSRIDAMIRNLRERSVPRGPVLTESGLIKRAVSVEDMTGAFNKRTVNRVLGLFKRIEKEQLEDGSNNVKNTKSSSTVDSLVYAASMERPKSGGFVSKLRKGRPYVGAISDTIISLTDQQHQQFLAGDVITTSDKMQRNQTKISATKCLDCNDESDALNVTKRHSNSELKPSTEEKERMRNNRKGLVLDFSKLEAAPPDYKTAMAMANTGYQNNNNNNINNNNNNNNNNSNNKNNNQTNDHYGHNNTVQNIPAVSNTTNPIQKQHYNNNNNNNSSYDESSTSEINANHMLTPSFDSITHYSSDSRSLHDDCASTCTFLSPTEEPELYFDDWSVCSEDTFAGGSVGGGGGGTSSSPSASRLSRNSQGASPMTKSNDSSESVIDRIKRRSFYCRFNVDKPKRQSNIVGTAARDYYREAAAKLKSRPADRIGSPSVATSTSSHTSLDRSASTKSTHEYYQPIKSTGSTHHYLHQQHHNQPSTAQLPPPHHHSHHHAHHHSHHHHSRSDDITSASSASKSMSGAAGSATRSMYDDDLRSYRPSEYMRTKSTYLPLPPSKSSSKITSSSDDYRYTPPSDYLSMKAAAHTSRIAGNGSSFAYDPLAPKYGTYNPKRRTSSYSSNGGGTTTSSSIVDTSASSSYATLGRKIRPYDHRSITMMDSTSGGGANSAPNTNSLYRRDSRTPTDFSTLTNSMRLRTTSVPRSPSNI